MRARNGGGQFRPRHALADHERRVERIDDQAAPGSPALVTGGSEARRQIRPTGHAPLGRVSELLSHPLHHWPERLSDDARLGPLDHPTPRPMREVKQLRQHRGMVGQPLCNHPPVPEAIRVALGDHPVPGLYEPQAADLEVGHAARSCSTSG